MRKSIIYLGMAVLSFTNVALASTGNLTDPTPKIMRTTFTGSPLCIAISKGDVAIVKKFIEYGASVNETSNGMTPLMFAARYNQVEILKLLIENGANLKAKDEKGFTALKYAEISGAKDAISYLQEALKK